MGIIEDAPNRSKLAKLLRFKSSRSGDKYVSLEEYISNMPEWQQDVYYIAGESTKAVKRSPFLEVASRKKVEVLYLVESIDECKSLSQLQHIESYCFTGTSCRATSIGLLDNNQYIHPILSL